MTVDDLPAPMRDRIVEDGDCWRWTGSVTARRHPQVSLDGRPVLARRAAWALAHGPIPAGRILRNTCGLWLCVHPDHARLTTYKGVADECAGLGLMAGKLRAARIAQTQRAAGKVTAEMAREIRTSDESCRTLARRHGISVTWAHRIRRGIAWRDYASPWAALGG